MKLFQLVIIIVLLSLLCFSCDSSENETIDGDIDSDSEVLENDNDESTDSELEQEIDTENGENDEEIEIENFDPIDCSEICSRLSGIKLEYYNSFYVSDYLLGSRDTSLRFVIEPDNKFYLEYLEYKQGERPSYIGKDIESLRYSGRLKEETIDDFFKNLYAKFSEPSNICGYFGKSGCSHWYSGHIFYYRNKSCNFYSYECDYSARFISNFIDELRASSSISHSCAYRLETQKEAVLDFYYFDKTEGSKKFFVVSENREWSYKKEYTNDDKQSKQQVCNGTFAQTDFEMFINELGFKLRGLACVETTEDCKNNQGGYIYFNRRNEMGNQYQNQNPHIFNFNCPWSHERMDQKSVAVPLEFINQRIETLLKDCQ